MGHVLVQAEERGRNFQLHDVGSPWGITGLTSKSCRKFLEEAKYTAAQVNERDQTWATIPSQHAQVHFGRRNLSMLQVQIRSDLVIGMLFVQI